MQSVRVLLVDDHKPFLDAAAAFLADSPKIVVVGKLLSSGEALEKVPQLRPHVVLMDLEMPDMNGLAAMLRLKAMEDPPHVVIVTDRTEPAYRELAEALHVDGFVAKHRFCKEIVPLLESLAEADSSSQKVT